MYHPISQKINASKHLPSPLSLGLLLLLAFGSCENVFAQGRSSLATQAAQLCQEKKLDEAMTTVQMALQDVTEKNQSYTWYVYGFVCKEIYKSRESSMRNSTHRLKAIEAFIQADQLQSNDDVNSNAPLRYLVNTLYNDALLQANEIGIDNETSADSLFAAYQSIAQQSKVHAASEIRACEEQFIKMKAQHYYELWSAQPDHTPFIDRSIELYSHLLEMNPQDCLNVYNIGVAYFNQAILQARLEGLDVMAMTRTQIAHSYFEKSAQLCPEDVMIQTALQLTTNDQSIEKDQTKKLSIKKK